uniref:Uncharacterized protein n=2 Tax=Oryza brachyantha TaxID=4533 RepID=J3KXZ3_ORYBR
MCMEGGRAAAGRRGGKKQQAAEQQQHKVAKQPQRGLGVAQLEKIRLHNQMVAALRSAGGGALHDDAPSPPPPFAAPPAMAASPFHHQHYLTDCFEPADHRRIAGVQPYYEGHLPYSSNRLAAAPAAFVAYEVKGDQQYASSGQRQPQYHSWMSSGYDGGHSGGRSSTGSSSEELDLELRL